MRKLALLTIALMWATWSYADDVKVQVNFCRPTEFGNFCDNLYFAPDEYAALSPRDISNRQTERVDNFIFQRRNQPPYQPPTREDLLIQRETAANEIASLDERIAQLQPAPVPIPVPAPDDEGGNP